LDEESAENFVHGRGHAVRKPMDLTKPSATDRYSTSKLTTNGHYTASSAYDIQFQGSFADYDWRRLWAAEAQNKCKMFWWLILQNRLWTENGGNTNQICPYSKLHMLALCPYSKLVRPGISIPTNTRPNAEGNIYSMEYLKGEVQ
jgi:hypothetical protein